MYSKLLTQNRQVGSKCKNKESPPHTQKKFWLDSCIISTLFLPRNGWIFFPTPNCRGLWDNLSYRLRVPVGRADQHFIFKCTSLLWQTYSSTLCAHFRSEKWNPKWPQRVRKANGTERGQPWSSVLWEDEESSKWACTSLVITHLTPRDW